MQVLANSSEVATVVGIVIMAYFFTDIIWGFICRSIVASKNYPEELNHGFAWGFFLNLIGLIVCACTPNYFQTYSGRMNAGQIDTHIRQQQAPVSEQITELKSMLDEGLITEEEFAAKKKQLLGL